MADDDKKKETYPEAFPVINRLFELYSAARTSKHTDPAVRDGVKRGYVLLKECMQGFFPVGAIDIPSMDPATKASAVRELGGSGNLLRQRFGMSFWFRMRGRAGGGEAVFIKREYFDSLEHWLTANGLAVELAENGSRPEHAEEDHHNSRHARRPRGQEGIDSYFADAEAKLRLEFNQRRGHLTDADVKGGENEKAVGEFLEKHVGSARIALNKQVIDSHGLNSGGMDVCVCNADQPAIDISLIIAEGVDFVVQVKAILTDAELPRIVKNCVSLKRLERRFSDGDEVFARRADYPFLVERIPYFVFAFESDLSLESVHERLSRLLEDELPFHWPDGVYVLNRGAIQHLHGETESFFRVEATKDKTMLKFLQQVHSVARVIRRLRSPLIHYFPTDVYHPR
jgi:hypothetical protein